jgi:MYXO-CTERM domain-containing protein
VWKTTNSDAAMARGARNESVLSNVVCIERVQVQGFWDAYCAERGMADVEACRANYSCSIEAGGGSAPACGWAVGLAALAAVARRRMRRAR